MQSNNEDLARTEPELFQSSLPFASMTFAAGIASMLLIGEATLPGQAPTGLPKLLAFFQDIPVAAAAILFFTLLARIRTAQGAFRLALRPWQVIGVLLAMTAAAWVIRMVVFQDYDLTRDEQMASFDSAIYGRGLLFQPFPPEWREWYQALNVNFILPIGDREGWVSNYLPGNAAIQALFQQVMPASMVSPVLLLIADLALWRIAVRLWPDSPATQAVVLLLFAGSSQALFMASTHYAMPAHLTLNLCWLWLFLKRRPAAHAGAMAVGFVASGLHQVVFHPIFVLLFLDLLRRERQWRLLAAYVVCYGAIGLFWLMWPGWVSGHGLHPVPAELRLDGVSFFERMKTLSPFTTLSFGLMGVNLLRFFAWQHLLLVPLLIVGLRAAFRAEPVCRALALGMLLLVVTMLILMPAQSHGWGYRYLHGFVGSAVLIAGFGWRQLEQDGAAPTRALLLSTALSVLVLVPLHAWMARGLVTPYADANAGLARMTADIVIVGDKVLPFGHDLVRNRPDLQNRPIRLRATKIEPESIARLCAGGRTITFARPSRFAAIYGFFKAPVPTGLEPSQAVLEHAAQAAGCRLIPDRS